MVPPFLRKFTRPHSYTRNECALVDSSCCTRRSSSARIHGDNNSSFVVGRLSRSLAKQSQSISCNSGGMLSGGGIGGGPVLSTIFDMRTKTANWPDAVGALSL